MIVHKLSSLGGSLRSLSTLVCLYDDLYFLSMVLCVSYEWRHVLLFNRVMFVSVYLVYLVIYLLA